MNRLLIIPIFVLLFGCAPEGYEDYFTEKRFRFDYVITGNFAHQEIDELNLFEEEIWGGSRINLIDTFEYGDYLLKIYDEKSDKLIYSRGFSDLFIEWQTTAEAKQVEKSYNQSILFPAPKKSVRMEILKRDSTMNFGVFFTRNIDPKSAEIIKSEVLPTTSRIIHKGSDYTEALDIVFLSEGYTKEEEDKFYSDVERFREFLFAWKPYKNYTDRINFTAVFAPSKESGVDIPGQDIFVETIADAHFYTFGIERYLTLPDLTKVYKYLVAYPVDQVVILANSDKYGGGGIYNFYNIFTSDNELGERLFLHEFGHGFAGLGDEYFNSAVAYEDFGSANYEPYEPNITNLVNFNVKWKSMVPDSVPIPTPDSSIYDNIVGVFEGANYVSKGFYRPYRDCAMRSSHMKFFCPVCEKSIEEMIMFYSK